MEKTVVTVGGLRIGEDFVLIAGPCAVESEEQTLDIARRVKQAGAHILRGGAFKPRTSPYSFQGLEIEGLKILRKAGDLTGLPVITEVMDTRFVSAVGEYTDIFQLGSRNMMNVSLLRELGRAKKPVLLKRGMSATLEEWLLSAQVVISEGNPRVILCERGIRSFESYTKNTLDLVAVPLAKELSGLPVIVDPSHGTGRADLVDRMSLAAVAAGADGLMIEVHSHPHEALSDRKQQITPEAFAGLAGRVLAFKRGLNRLPPAFSGAAGTAA